MDLKIAVRMLAVLALGSAMVAAVAAQREDGTEEASQDLLRPGDAPAVAELVRCRDLGMAAANDAACKRAWAENRRRFFGTRAPQRTTAPKPERPGANRPPAEEPLPPPSMKDMERLPSGNADQPDAEGTRMP